MSSDRAERVTAPVEWGRWRRSQSAARIELNRTSGCLMILTVVHAGEGGTILTNEDLMRALARDKHLCFILSCGPRKWVLESVANEVVRRQEVTFEHDWRSWEAPREDRMVAFRDLVQRLLPDVVHLRSFLGCGPEIASEAKCLGCGVVVSYHDYSAVCPNIHLLDAAGHHCAGTCTPDPEDCSAPEKWFAGMARLKNGYVHDWRARVSQALSQADYHVTTSPSAARLLRRQLRHLHDRRVRVIEHGRHAKRLRAARIPTPNEPPAVLVLGAKEEAKGRRLVEDLIARNRASGGPFVFHLLGGREPVEVDLEGGVVRHGPYRRDDLPVMLQEIGPSFSLVASIWPETFSHTLTESWLAGVPVLASNLGAPAERVRVCGGGWLLDPHDPAAWWATLSRASKDPRDWAAKAREIELIKFRDSAAMARDYAELYARAAARRCVRR